jgi:ubiquinone/menaquinone biosynthesis C-methylase UbiE
MNDSYIMESPAEYKRLELKTERSCVADFALRAGLAPGMKAADLACGAGVTTSVLGEIVGGDGFALGIDASEDRIAMAREKYSRHNVDFERRDLLQPLGYPEPFDFVWMRFTLEYFRKQNLDIVRNAASIIRQDGVLCLIDLDYNCLSHYGMSARLETAFIYAVAQLEEKANFDPYAGRKLYSHLYQLGFKDIKVTAGAHHLIYGDLGEVDELNWRQKIETLCSNFKVELPGYDNVSEFQKDFMEFFKSPSRFSYTPIIAAWGRKA